MLRSSSDNVKYGGIGDYEDYRDQGSDDYRRTRVLLRVESACHDRLRRPREQAECVRNKQACGKVRVRAGEFAGLEQKLHDRQGKHNNVNGRRYRKEQYESN